MSLFRPVDEHSIVSFANIRNYTDMPSLVPRIHFDKMFGVDVEVLMSSKVTSMVRGSLNGFRVYLHIATDGAVVQKKAGVGICAM